MALTSKKTKRKYQEGGAALDYDQQMMEMQGTAPEESEDSFGKALTEISADLTPGIGEVRSVMDAKKSFEEGDALGVGLGVLGAVPGIGIGARGLKSFVKAGKVAEGVKNLNSVSDEAFETVLKEIPPPKLKGTKEDDPFELINVNREEWRAANKQKYKKPESEMVLQDAALKLDAGEITPQEFRKLADKAAPYSYNTKVPKLYTDEAVAASLPTEKFVKQHGIIGLNKAVPEGAQVESRFDINAYLHYNVYSATIQGVKEAESLGKKSGVFGYAKTVVLDNVNLRLSEKEKEDAFKIAKGRAKSPFITMKGKWRNHNPEAIHAFAEKIIEAEQKGIDTGWVQVSVNPSKSGSFVAVRKNKETGELVTNPIEQADKIIQIGKMVLAKVDPTNLKTWDEYYKTNKFAQGGMMLPQERQPMYSSTITTPAGSQSDTDTGGVIAVPQEETTAATTTQTNPMDAVRMPPGMAKGGMLQEGGLLQEGGTVDPASGNEVPTGSLQEEVRDDIPAQLSEGEFVFPADVVRFIGLERLMKMRQAAKEGLQKMNDMGQMGNAEEATMDDGADTEFETEIDDILAEVEREGQQA